MQQLYIRRQQYSSKYITGHNINMAKHRM